MIGVIGGTGVYGISSELCDIERLPIEETPFGETSSAIVVGRLRECPEKRIAFIARHGEGHRYLPSEVPYAANIYALKRLGVRAILSFSAVGSLQEGHRPGDFVVPLQFIDCTRGQRRGTFFGSGCVAHVSFADPTSPELCQEIKRIADAHLPPGRVDVSLGGTYVCMEGPAFSTRAESELYRSWGADVIGMTNATEAKLAREAEIAYATVAMVTDYDCWRANEAAVTADAVAEIMHRNGDNALLLLRTVVRHLDASADYPAHHALCGAIMSKKSAIPPETYESLKLIIGKYLD